MSDPVIRLRAALEGSGKNHRGRLRIFGPLLVLSGLGCAEDPTGPVLCDGRADATIVTFEDANLEAEIRTKLAVGSQADLTCVLVSGLSELAARGVGIASLAGIENLTGLVDLDLDSNFITDISPLSGLTSLTWLQLDNNSITDVGALSGLTNLTHLGLSLNSIADIRALSGMTGLTSLWLLWNSISDISPLNNLTSLTRLVISNNSVSDVGPLSELTGLVYLFLDSNSITNISALSGLTSLTHLILGYNRALSNIQPLLDNSGLGAGDLVALQSTSVSCTDVAALQAKGLFEVVSDCP